MNQVEEVLATHVKHTRYLCQSVSLGPVMIKHDGRDPAPLVLRCRKDTDEQGRHLDKNPDHKDMIHCYQFHRFGPDMATVEFYNPEDISTCTKCRTSWPCDAVKVAEMCDSELVAW
jgi:hypothetical protein